MNNQVNLNGSVNAQHTTLDTSRSDPNTTERDEDHTEPLGGNKTVKRKGAKGINHFSYCDRATQTTVPPIRVINYLKSVSVHVNQIIQTFYGFILPVSYCADRGSFSGFVLFDDQFLDNF